MKEGKLEANRQKENVKRAHMTMQKWLIDEKVCGFILLY